MTMNLTLGDLEPLAVEMAETRRRLGELLDTLDVEVKALQRQKLPDIRAAMADAAEAEAQLRRAIPDAPGVFESQRTIIIQGIRIGFRRSRAGVAVADDDHTQELIANQLPTLSDRLIRTAHKLVRGELNKLTDDQLERIGCARIEPCDEVITKPVSDAIEKALNRLLAEAVDQLEED